MSIFLDRRIEAMAGGGFICSGCGGVMEFEGEWEDTLVCPHCGRSIDLDEYGCEGDEKYENVYPTREDVLGIADEDE